MWSQISFHSMEISIHALREEGDQGCNPCIDSPRLFQSTPSARRATAEIIAQNKFKYISIHALREEGDARPRKKRR